MMEHEWIRPKPTPEQQRADVVLALVLALGAFTTSLLYARVDLFGGELATPWQWTLGLALVTLPLAVRRRYPVPVLAVVSVGFFLCGEWLVPEILFTNVAMFISLYTVGAWEQRRNLALWARIIVPALMMLWVIVSLILASSDPDAFPGISRSGLFSAYAVFAVIQIFTNLAYFGGAIFFGEKAWTSARLRASLEAQARELELERRTSAEQAVALDRLSIARELHDVVAHHVSVMGIQAAAASRILKRSPDDAKAALQVVEESATTAIQELRDIVHTLRTPESDQPGTTVGVAKIPQLVEEAILAGVPTTFITVGPQRPLPMLIDVALYRVVQEALTNTRKHGGAAVTSEVRLRFLEDSVEVEVSDTGVRQSARRVQGSVHNEVKGGLGLRGMRERVGAVGGTITAGPRERGGFIVTASVPLGVAPTPVRGERRATA